jgi:hypothetical protein
MKKCTKCGDVKSVEGFSKDKKSNDGLKPYCKKCASIAYKIYKEKYPNKRKEYYQKNIQTIRCKGKEYRKKNRDKKNKYAKEYRAANRDKILKQLKEYYHKNKEKNKERRYEYFKNYYKNNKHKVQEYYQKNKEKIREKDKIYYHKNKDAIKKYQIEYNKKHKEYQKKYHAEYHKKNKEKKSEYAKEYAKKNREKINARQRNRLKTDPLYKMRSNISHRNWEVFKRGGYKKDSTSEKLLGIDYGRCKLYLERQFTKGMSWDNYGEWHIDHIIPLASATNEIEMRKLCHYTNLQPLWASDNLSKAATIPEVQIRLRI